MSEVLSKISSLFSPLILLFIPLYGFIRGIPVYSSFIKGAKEGITTAFKILPYMIAILFVTGILRESGGMDIITAIFSPVGKLLGVPPEVIPMGIMRSVSGSGASGMLLDILKTHGPDSLIGITASVSMGSTETTLYCVSLYYGYVGIKNSRYTIPAGLFCDLISLIAASFISGIFV